MFKLLPTLPLAALALAAPALVQAQNYSDLPPLPPMRDAEVRALPEDMRSAPVMPREEETRTVVDGVETITRTRRIDSPRAAHGGQGYAQPYSPGYTQGYAAPIAPAGGYYTGTPAVFERQQWIEECRRRTRGRNRNDTGLIIGGLLGAIAGGFAGNEIAGAGDKVLGTVLGVGGGGLIGGLIGSLFDGGRRRSLYDCEAALDSYLSAYGTPDARIASREIAYPGYYAAPAYDYGYGYPQSYGYTYAPPPQMVMVPVRTQVPQQVVVRENERYETYTVPGAERTIPAPSPKMIKYTSPKMIKNR